MLIAGAFLLSLLATYRKLGWRHCTIAGMSEADIAVLERHNPWISPKERAAA